MYIVAVALLFALFHAVNNYLMICIDRFVALTIWVELNVSVSVSVSVSAQDVHLRLAKN